jgi:hypothetical protein
MGDTTYRMINTPESDTGERRAEDTVSVSHVSLTCEGLIPALTTSAEIDTDIAEILNKDERHKKEETEKTETISEWKGIENEILLSGIEMEIDNEENRPTLKKEDEPIPGFSDEQRIAQWCSNSQPKVKLTSCTNKPRIKYVENIDARIKQKNIESNEYRNNDGCEERRPY